MCAPVCVCLRLCVYVCAYVCLCVCVRILTTWSTGSSSPGGRSSCGCCPVVSRTSPRSLTSSARDTTPVTGSDITCSWKLQHQSRVTHTVHTLPMPWNNRTDQLLVCLFNYLTNERTCYSRKYTHIYLTVNYSKLIWTITWPWFEIVINNIKWDVTGKRTDSILSTLIYAIQI